MALVDGVCMGGGIGISVHGSHRIATERAMFAMPETAIALFPDVGTSYLLPRLPGALGYYMGLTGARMVGADAVHAGLATHFVRRDLLPALEAALVRDGVAVIAAFSEPLPAFSLAAARKVIDTAFSAPSVADIVARLEADGSAFAAETLAILRLHSPSAVHWSFAILRAGAHRSLPAALDAELALAVQVTSLPEFLKACAPFWWTRTARRTGSQRGWRMWIRLRSARFSPIGLKHQEQQHFRIRDEVAPCQAVRLLEQPVKPFQPAPPHPSRRALPGSGTIFERAANA